MWNRLNHNDFMGNGEPDWNWRKKFLSLALSFFFFGALFLLLVMKGDSSVPAVQHIMICWFNSSQLFKQSTSVLVETKTSSIVCGAQRCFLFNWHSMGSPQKIFLAKHSCNKQFEVSSNANAPFFSNAIWLATENIARIAKCFKSMNCINCLYF